jgi:hypothetical protein
MSLVLDYLRGLIRATRDGWDRFWFTPTDPATLGIIRILAGAMLFYTHLVWSFDLADFFTDQGWLSPEAVQLVQRNSWTWSYFWWIKYLDADGVRYFGKTAQGNGGQKIFIWEEQNMVTVITGGNYNVQSPSDELISKYILPAFNKKTDK